MSLRNLTLTASAWVSLGVLAATLPTSADGQPSMDPFAGADANRDGIITLAEFQQARGAKFDQIDRNRDGVVRMSDIPAFMRTSAQGAQLQRLIGMADANQDGPLTRNEPLKSPPVAFNPAAANKDGQVTGSELTAARARAEKTVAGR